MQLYNYRKKKRRRRHVFQSSYQQRYYRKRSKKSGKKTGMIVLILCLVLAGIAGAGAGGFFYLKESGKNALMAYAGDVKMEMDGSQDKAGLVSRNGKKYRYNEDIITLLCMGIDQGNENWQTEAALGENGQADAIFLLVLDQKSHRLKLIGISRDTMTEIATYDNQGKYVGESLNHLALAFSYGKTKEEGAQMTVDAVSKLFYQLPIHGYAAIDWDALGKINDSVGGVAVTLMQDMNLGGQQYYSGERVRLTGGQAQSYVRHRGGELGSNNERMQRQRTYVSAFLSEAKAAMKKDMFVAADLYQELTADMVTSVGLNEAVYLASLLPSAQFGGEDMMMVEGTVKQGTPYDEFYVDEDCLTDLILEVFYEEV